MIGLARVVPRLPAPGFTIRRLVCQPIGLGRATAVEAPRSAILSAELGPTKAVAGPGTCCTLVALVGRLRGQLPLPAAGCQRHQAQAQQQRR